MCTTTVGVLLLAILSLGRADIYPGDASFQSICQQIINGVEGNSIQFLEVVTATCPGCSNTIHIRETITRGTLCDRLTTQHNNKNAAYLGGTNVLSSECQAALLNPDPYGVPEWNHRSGRHCGAWKNTDSNGMVTQTFSDHAVFNPAVIYPISGIGIVRQSVTFFTRSCCNHAWTESGGNQIVVWGWDPKDTTNQFGFQGSVAGYPFTSNSGADCIVWVTRQEAFLDCIKTVSSSKKRASAGFWGFGQWIVKPIIGSFCPVIAEPIKQIPGRLQGLP